MGTNEHRVGSGVGTGVWQDKEDDLSDAIRASHPMRTGRHDLYEKANALVHNRQSKGALVALVNHLLAEISDAGSDGYDSVVEITKLKARIAELETALAPFADVDGEGDEDFPDDTRSTITFGRTHFYAIRLGDFRRARAALLESDG